MIDLLLVDDDEDDRDLFCLAIQDLVPSIRISIAVNGEDALKMLSEDKHYRPDFIFLDLNLPRITGKECLAQLKKTDHLRDIPVIIYTTSKLQEDKAETKKLGATHFITKPSKLTELNEALLFVLNNRAAVHNNKHV
jgi:CheY-like chemotaxis protein